MNAIETENRARAAAQRQLDAYNSGDIEAFAACYTEDVEIFDLRSGETTGRGRAYIHERYGALFERAPELTARVTSRQITQNVVFDHEVITGVGPEPRFATAIYEVRDDGLIQKVWFVS